MHLPQEVSTILAALQGAGFEAYAVGGGVRDILLKREPKDWDVATNAKPEDIQQLFPKSFYTNAFGTVTVLTESQNPHLAQVEVTTYRVDASYSDQRHPDTVSFTDSLKEDLSRRDFTINAMALAPSPDEGGSGAVKKINPLTSPLSGGNQSVVLDNMLMIDPFGGMKDLDTGLIRAVGEPSERFKEDALRLMRAVRLAAQLNFTIEETTLAAIKANAQLIAAVSPERIRDELIKLLLSDHPEAGFQLLEQTSLLAIVLPELQEGVGVGQNKHHIYTVFEHNIKSAQFAANYEYPLHVRLAALLHDVGKPRTKRRQGNDYTFYAHDIVGARMAEKLLKHLHFPNEVVTQVTHLVRHHMFYYDVGKVTEAGMRRLLRRVGPEHFDDLIKLRIAERKGSGVPKAEPYRLRHLQFMAEKVSQQAISVGQLAINGTDLMQELKLKPSAQIGGILNALLAEVIEDPLKNNREYLLKRAQALKEHDPKELKALGEAAKEEEQKQQDDTIRRKYHV